VYGQFACCFHNQLVQNKEKYQGTQQIEAIGTLN